MCIYRGRFYETFKQIFCLCNTIALHFHPLVYKEAAVITTHKRANLYPFTFTVLQRLKTFTCVRGGTHFDGIVNLIMQDNLLLIYTDELGIVVGKRRESRGNGTSCWSSLTAGPIMEMEYYTVYMQERKKICKEWGFELTPWKVGVGT